jgi:hypothetical protein
MEIRAFDRLNREMEMDMPRFEHLDDGMDYVLSKIYQWGEDLYEQEYFLYKRWLEVREEEHFHESVLHIFNDGGEYLVSIDGNIQKGAWRFLAESNTFITDFLGKTELYDLAFLNDDYFVLSKHGDQARKGQRRYFVMGREGVVSGLIWHEVLDQMFNIYRSSSKFIFFLVIAVAIVAVILAYSLL